MLACLGMEQLNIKPKKLFGVQFVTIIKGIGYVLTELNIHFDSLTYNCFISTNGYKKECLFYAKRYKC